MAGPIAYGLQSLSQSLPKETPKAVEDEEGYGPWMLVKSRKPRKKVNEKAKASAQSDSLHQNEANHQISTSGKKSITQQWKAIEQNASDKALKIDSLKQSDLPNPRESKKAEKAPVSEQQVEIQKPVWPYSEPTDVTCANRYMTSVTKVTCGKNFSNLSF